MTDSSDEHLVALATGGDQQAYGWIVERYQNLICSLAYSVCGDFSLSEDLAQETFVVAWKELAGLRDASHLRAWLGGIVRKLAANHQRRKVRSGHEATLPLDGIEEPGSAGASPRDALIDEEQNQLIWSSLESTPEIYRTALVLFYRQDQSVEEVARALGITPETARQRLSRGRALLREKMLVLVERALSATRPSKAFTVATLSALPVLSAPVTAASTAAMSAKGAAIAASGAKLTLWGAMLGPLLGLAGGWLGSRAAIASARSPRERRFLVRVTGWTFAATIAFAVGLTLLLVYAAPVRARSEGLHLALLVGLIAVHGVGITAGVWWANRRLQQIFAADRDRQALYPEVSTLPDRPVREYKSRASLLGLPLVHIAFGGVERGAVKRGKAIGWVAVGDVSFGILLSIGGIAVGGIAIGGLACGLVAIAGLAVGGLALGGGAVGWMAAGGMALAGYAAFGGLAMAVDHAIGGMAIANEANTHVARERLASNPILTGAQMVMSHSRWLLLLTIWPLLAAWRSRGRRAGASAAANRD